MLNHQRQDALSLPKIKPHLERATPGQHALLCLLKSDALHDLAYLAHPTFLSAVAHCLVAEGGLGYLLHWTMVEDNPIATVAMDALGGKFGRDNSFWRGRLLLHTMEAQAYWTERPLFLEDSVDTWLSIVRKAADQRVFISPAVSARWLAQRSKSPGLA